MLHNWDVYKIKVIREKKCSKKNCPLKIPDGSAKYAKIIIMVFKQIQRCIRLP